MRKYLKIIIPVFIIVAAVGIYYGLSEYNRKPKDNAKQDADITISAQDLFAAYSSDETKANSMYLDKVIGVSGSVTSVEKDDAGLYTIHLESGDPMSSVSCQMDERHSKDAETVKEGDAMKIKGTCTGMLMDVVLIRCAIDN